MDTTVTMPGPGAIPAAPLQVEQSLLERAKNNDVEAIARMFQQFMPGAGYYLISVNNGALSGDPY